MRAGCHVLTRRFRCQHSTERESTTNAFGCGHYVWTHTDKLVREQLSATAHARLHLVENQQQTVLVAQRAQARKELL